MSRILASIRHLKVLPACLMLMALFTMTSCDLAANYNKADRAATAETQDFRDGLAERLPETEDESETAGGTIPSLQPYVSTNSSTIKPMPLVSVSVNQSVPVRDTLFELAEQAGYDIELDPRIKGSIILTARNKPFDVVVDKICQMSGLRYKMDDDSLRVEVDEPYNKIYKIDYLSMIRSNEGSVNTNLSVVSGGGTDTGSSYSVSSESASDFWAELDLNLKQILNGVSTGAMKTKSDPKISSAPKNNKKEGEGEDSDENAGATSEDENESEQTAEDDSKGEDEPEAVLTVESLPVSGDDAEDPENSKNGKEAGASFTINKQAGMINVLATERGHKQVEAYLKELRRSITSQVLIEAKIFEVNLKDEYITGIDWSILGISSGEGFGSFITDSAVTTINSMLAPGGSQGFPVPPPTSAEVVSASNVTIGYAGNDVQALITAISGFGTVRALASPRLTVMNNQSAVLNVATNNVYFELDVDSSVDDDTGVRTTEVDSSIKSVPEGVLVNVQPSINLDDRTIALSVRPTVSRIVGFEDDPAVAFIVAAIPEAANITSSIPEVNVQEIDTMVKVRSGQAIVMGGLLQDRTFSEREAVPVLGEVPVIGSAFRKHTDLIEKTELVILLKATLLDSPEETVHDTDRDLYRRFSGDRRPFKI